MGNQESPEGKAKSERPERAEPQTKTEQISASISPDQERPDPKDMLAALDRYKSSSLGGDDEAKPYTEDSERF